MTSKKNYAKEVRVISETLRQAMALNIREDAIKNGDLKSLEELRALRQELISNCQEYKKEQPQQASLIDKMIAVETAHVLVLSQDISTLNQYKKTRN